MKRNFFRTCTLIGALGALAACGEKTVGPRSGLTPNGKISPSATDPFNDQGNCLAADFALTTASPDLSTPGQHCTANDIAIAQSTLISYSTDGVTFIPFTGQSIQCNKGDPIFVNLAATLGQTDNSARTDIGVWIATDGGNARTGVCNHYNLVSPPLNQTIGGVSNTDGDSCGDMTSANAAPSIPLGIITSVCESSPTSADSLHIGSCLSWSQTDVACPSTDPNFPGPLGFRVGTLPGTSSKCNCNGFNVPIIVNQTAKLEVVKACSPTTDPGLFNLLIDADIKAPDAACGGTTGSLEVGAGTSANPGASHAFSETQGTGTLLSNYNSTRTCVNRVGGTVRLASAAGTGGSVTLQPDDDVICTITNTRKTGTIKITKISNGGTGIFPFTSTGGLPSPANGAGAFSITTATQGVGVTATFSNIPTGSYSVTETLASLPTGFSLTTLSCIGGGGNTSSVLATGVSTVGLDENETITCTYTNTKSATLIIEKKSTGGVGQFDFTSTGGLPSPADGAGAFSLTTVTQGVAVSKTFSSLTPGTAYGVSENIPSDYDLTSRVCVATDAGAGGSVFPASGTTQPATITLAAGATITCTYTDRKKATLVIEKKSTGGVGQFDFTSTGGLPSPADGAGAFSLTTVTQGVAVSKTFSNLTPGTAYGVSETVPVPSDYDLTSRVCVATDAGVGGSVFPASGTTQPATITLAAGATITCTYTNTRKAQLRIEKVTLPDGDLTDFTFTPTNWNSGSTFTRRDNQAAFASGFSLTPGATVYSTVESVPAGWALTGRACVLTGTATAKTSTNITNGISLSLAAGEDVTCTFTNTELSTIIIEKEVIGGGTSSFTFTRVKVGGGDLGDNAGPTLQDGGSSSSGKKLTAGTYTVCETNLAAGFSDPTATGFTLTGDGFGNFCTPVTLGVNDTKTVHFINRAPPPSGSTRTIGYWKNWSSCAQSNGGQYTKAIKNGTPQGTLDFYLTGAGAVSIYPIGNITSLTCAQAVNLLAKNQVGGTKAAGDPIYNMVAQLLGAKLNLAASAGSCTALNNALPQAQTLLVTLNFLGTKSYAKTLTAAQASLANSLGAIFDSYNQGTLGGGCPTHI